MFHLHNVICKNCSEVYCEFCEIECPKCHSVYYNSNESVNLRKQAKQYNICNAPVNDDDDIQEFLNNVEGMRRGGRLFDALRLCYQARRLLSKQANAYAVNQVGFNNAWDLQFEGSDEEVVQKWHDADIKKNDKFLEYINTNSLSLKVSESLSDVLSELGDEVLASVFKKEVDWFVNKATITTP